MYHSKPFDPKIGLQVEVAPAVAKQQMEKRCCEITDWKNTKMNY